jgi:hypothetical protein
MFHLVTSPDQFVRVWFTGVNCKDLPPEWNRFASPLCNPPNSGEFGYAKSASLSASATSALTLRFGTNQKPHQAHETIRVAVL